MTGRVVADTLEDLQWLDEMGVGATEAARRTDFATAHAMEKWLERAGRADLWLSLKRRDPAGTHLSGSDRKKKSLMSVPTEPVDTIAALLDEASKSTKARTRNRATKVAEMVADLRTTLAAEREDMQRREKARKEVERLERALAAAKAEMRGGSVGLDADGVSAAELREWAARNGIECPTTGRVPQRVRNAYDESEQAAS